MDPEEPKPTLEYGRPEARQTTKGLDQPLPMRWWPWLIGVIIMLCLLVLLFLWHRRMWLEIRQFMQRGI